MVNILLRLRVKDLVSCRRVSKQWLSIIDDPHFISRQLQRSISTNSNAALFLQDRESPTLYWKQNYTSDVNFFSIQIHYEPSQIMYEPSQVLLMGSCHGLVCFSLFNHPNDFVVLNPSTGERHKVIISANEERVDDTRLSLCGVSKERPKICIWVMEEYGNPESWNMLYYIDYYWCFPYSVTTLGSNGDKIKLLIDWQKFAWCDPSKNKDETISINYTKWPNGYYEAEYCLESLVKIFPNQTADVKKDDADEKQLKKLADQEITEDELPAFLNLHNLKSLVYESDLEQYWHEGCYFSRVQSI
ncbi:F-box protein CPR1 [Linum perenne]